MERDQKIQQKEHLVALMKDAEDNRLYESVTDKQNMTAEETFKLFSVSVRIRLHKIKTKNVQENHILRSKLLDLKITNEEIQGKFLHTILSC